MSDLRLVYVTAADRAQAVALARALVERRLVACANVFDPVTSVFWWDGRAQDESEAVLIAKTTAERMPAVTETIRKLHPYDVPCCVALPIAEGEGNPDFLSWIREEATGQST
ncbi:MAG: divalent-cation tolerance protein CutA [Alphaproteobacteria bacterium]